MKAFAYGVLLQWKIDFRRKDVLVMYYLMPLIFFLSMGGVFSSINFEMTKTLISSMTVFALTAGGYMGVSLSVSDFYQNELKKAYRVGGIPLWTPLINSLVSAFIHLSIVACVICLGSPLLFDADPLQKATPYFIGTIGLLCANGAVGAFLGLFIKSPSKISMASMLLFFPSVLLSGIMMPSDFLPSILQSIGGFFPATWAFKAMNGIEFEWNTLLLFGLFVALMVVNLIRVRILSRE